MTKEVLYGDIDFNCNFGTWPFRESLDISAAGFMYRGELFPFPMVTRIRWGIEEQRGEPFLKELFLVAFGTESSEVVVKTGSRELYEELTQRVWRAVGQRLLAEMLVGLRDARMYQFGDFVVVDDGILTQRDDSAAIGSGFYRWENLKWNIDNGSLVFSSVDDTAKRVASASLLRVDNAHVLSIALKLFEKHPQSTRLSVIAE